MVGGLAKNKGDVQKEQDEVYARTKWQNHRESEKYFRFSFSPSFLALVSDYHWSNISGGQMERKSGKYSVQRSSPCDTDWSRGWAENIPEHKQAKRTPWEQTPGLPHHTQHIT